MSSFWDIKGNEYGEHGHNNYMIHRKSEKFLHLHTEPVLSIGRVGNIHEIYPSRYCWFGIRFDYQSVKEAFHENLTPS